MDRLEWLWYTLPTGGSASGRGGAGGSRGKERGVLGGDERGGGTEGKGRGRSVIGGVMNFSLLLSMVYTVVLSM